MPNKTLISLAVASSIALTGCLDDGSSDKNANPEYSIEDTTIDKSLTRPLFNPYPTSDEFTLPTNHDLALIIGATQADTYDFTGYTVPTNPATKAVNDLAGFSTNAQIDIPFDGSLNPATVIANKTVFLVPLNMLPLSENLKAIEWTANPSFINTTAPFNVELYKTLNYRAEVVSLDGGTNNTLRITPLKPLPDGTKFLVVATDDVRNAAGKPTAQPTIYNDIIGGSVIGDPLDGVESIVQAGHKLAAAWVGANKIDAEVTLGYTFTTQDTKTVMSALTSPAVYLEKLGQQVVLYSALQVIRENTDIPSEELTAQDLYEALSDALSAEPENPALALKVGEAIAPYQLHPELGTQVVGSVVSGLPFPKPRTAKFYSVDGAETLASVVAADNPTLDVAASTVSVAQGAIELPYYLQLPGDDGSGLVEGMWRGSTTLETKLNDTIDAFKGAHPTLSNFSFPRDSDGTFNVTQYMPFPEQNGKVVVPVTVFYPDAQSGCTEVSDVVIFQHGVTVDRSTATLPAINLAASGRLATGACIATVAIDQPLHGLSGEFAGTIPGLTPLKAYVDPSDFPAADIVGERHFNYTAIPNTLTPAKKESFAEVSSGSLFVNLQSLQTTRDNLRQGVMDLLNLSATIHDGGFDSVEAAAPFPPLAGAKFHFIGHSLGGITGTSFAALSNDPQLRGAYTAAFAGTPFAQADYPPLTSVALMNTGGQLTKLVENSGALAPRVLAGLAAAGVTQGSSDFESFMYVFQSTVDSADPVNYALMLGESTLRTTISEVVTDFTVPNEADVTPLGDALPAPLAGTEPLMALLDLGLEEEPTELHDGVGYKLVNDANLTPVAGPAASFFFGQNPCTTANHGTFVAPVAPADALCPAGSDTSAAFSGMISLVLSNIVDMPLTFAEGINASAILGDSPTAEVVLDQAP